nr:MAG TPA: hypothetical protein [Caudoviricetes sp.]DAO97658.1 MAG TPA: hypothetical protein [Caudoviricetes sp.]
MLRVKHSSFFTLLFVVIPRTPRALRTGANHGHCTK